MIYDPFTIDHTHDNIFVLNKFSVVNNKLLWNGIEIGSNSVVTWGSITGNILDNTALTNALNSKVSTVNLSVGVRSTSLSGFDTSGATGVVLSTDTLLDAIEKLQYQITNLPPSNGGSGGVSNNVAGVFNVYSNTPDSRYAVSNSKVQAGSLVVSGRGINYGGGVGGWQENTAQMILEFGAGGNIKHSEIAVEMEGVGVYGLFRFFSNTNLAGNIQREITYGRNLGVGNFNVNRFVGNALVVAKESIDLNPFSNWYIDDRPTLNVIGKYPSIQVISRNNDNTTHGNGFKFLWMSGVNTYRSLNIGQVREGKEFHLGFYEGTDLNTHLGLNDNTTITGLSMIMPGFSGDNVLGNSWGVGINCKDVKLNLAIRGINDETGTFGFGRNFSRTEKKSDSKSKSNLVDRQSGFYRPVDSPSNYPSGSDGNTLLIQAQHEGSSSYYFQIANSSYSNDDLFYRISDRDWQQYVRFNPSTGVSNGVLVGGNAHNEVLKLGTKNNQDVICLQNNEERMKLVNRFQVLINNGTSNGITYPHLSFYGDQGTGLSLESSGQLALVTGQTKRFWVNGGSTVECNLPINTTQEYRINGNTAVKSPTTISSLGVNPTLQQVADKVNEIINALKNHHKLFS